MGDLRPLGSERLEGTDKIRRIMEIARYNEVQPASINENKTFEYVIQLADGNFYGIIREKSGYIVKKGLTESVLDYAEPMKNRKYFNSYSQAMRKINLIAGELNRLNENEEGVSLYGEQKKFTLKTPKPAQEEMPAPVAEVPAAPPAVPSPELPPSPEGEEMDMGIEGEEMGPEGEEMDFDMDVETEKSEEDTDEVTFKTIQKLTGKLTQKIRVLDSQEGMTSEDIKYVINMVLSSLDLKSISEEDKEDIMSKFEEDSENLGGDDMDGEDMTDDTEVEDIQADMDVDIDQTEPEMGEGQGAIFDSIFKESKVDKVISKYFEVSKKEILENKERKANKQQLIREGVKQKMKDVVKMTETFEQELASKKFLEENYSFQFIGITNKKNLVFENKTKQVKISPQGLVI